MERDRCATGLAYTEQTSWLLFLKYLEGLEQDKVLEAGLEDHDDRFILDDPYRANFFSKQRAFLDFVLSHHVTIGV